MRARLALAASTALLVGCAVPLEDVRPTSLPKTDKDDAPAYSSAARCHGLARDEAFWSSIASGFTVAAGAGGVASIPVEDRYRAWTLGGGIAASAVATFAQLYGRKLAEAWVRECITPRAHALLDDEESTEERASGADACARAGKRLAELRCPEARADFATFCRHALKQGVPLCPTKLARIASCADVDKVCR